MSPRSRWAAWVVILGAIVWSAVETEVSLGRLIEGLPFMWDFLRRMVPPDLSVLGNALRGAMETIQIAVVGTAVAAVLALPLGFAAARNAAPPWLFYWARSLLNPISGIFLEPITSCPSDGRLSMIWRTKSRTVGFSISSKSSMNREKALG